MRLIMNRLNQLGPGAGKFDRMRGCMLKFGHEARTPSISSDSGVRLRHCTRTDGQERARDSRCAHPPDECAHLDHGDAAQEAAAMDVQHSAEQDLRAALAGAESGVSLLVPIAPG